MPDFANGKKPRLAPKPHEVFQRHLRQSMAVLGFMIVFLGMAYLIAVWAWEWRHRQFTKGIPAAEKVEAQRAKNVPLINTSTSRISQRPLGNEDSLQRAQLLEREGDMHAEAGRFAQAITSYTQAIASWSDIASVYPKLGRAYLRTRSYSRARFALEKATQLYPTDPDLFNDLGVAFFQLGRIDRAAAQFDAALALVPNYAPAHFNKSLCRRAMGDETGAQSALDRFLQLRPDDPQGLKEKAFFLAARREYAGALELLHRAIANAPQWPAAYFDAAATAALMNHDKDAVRFLKTAEDLSSSAAAYLALQQPAFAGIRSNESVQAYLRDLLQRAKAGGDGVRIVYKPGTPEPMVSFQQVP